MVETTTASQPLTVSAQMIDGILVVCRSISNPPQPVSLDHFCSQARTNCLSHKPAISADNPTATGTRTSRQLSLSQLMVYLLYAIPVHELISSSPGLILAYNRWYDVAIRDGADQFNGSVVQCGDNGLVAASREPDRVTQQSVGCCSTRLGSTSSVIIIHHHRSFGIWRLR
jgi:hypothetical protein